MIALPLETWVSVGTLLGVLVTVLLAARSMSAGLRAEIAGLPGEFKADLAATETRVMSRIDEQSDRIDEQSARISELDRRVYELASGLRPHIEAAREGRVAGEG